MEIKRNYYLNKLITKKHNGLIKVITGMSRCGKSYLLFFIFKKHLIESGVPEDHIIEIAFDSYENKKLRDPEVLYPYVKEKIVDDQKISVNTVKSYLDYLCDAFIVSRATRYDIKGRKYIDTPQKYYFSDVGLRNARINFRQIEENHTMENIIFNELVGRDFNVDVGLVCIRKDDESGKITRKQLEVDFVCNKGSKRYYVESAFAIPDDAKMQQESNSLLRIDDNFKNIIVVKDTPAPWYTDDGILVISVYDFLLNAVNR